MRELASGLNWEIHVSRHAMSDVLLTELGPATALALVGFRAHAFGRADCCCVRSGFSAALGRDAHEALAVLLVFTRIMGHEGGRKISLAAPGCGRMTRDELSIACAFSAAQAWDDVAMDAHLSWLLGGPVPQSLKTLVGKIGDIFAGHGMAFEAPVEARRVPAGSTPAFRLVGTS